MKIITWNVNGIRSCAQKGLAEYVTSQDPDLFCIQETKAHPDQLDESVRQPPGREGYWSSALRKGYSGVATFFKQRPTHVEYGIGIRKFDSEGRFVVTDHDRFVLYNVYFPNGGSGEERHAFKQEFLQRFTEHLVQEMASGRELIVVGDYNVAYLDQDVFDPKKLASASGFLPEERQWFRDFLKAGFVDTFRHFHADEPDRYTWWSYQDRGRLANRGWRIDHVCISKGLLPYLRRAEIHNFVEGSDHCPVMIELGD